MDTKELAEYIIDNKHENEASRTIAKAYLTQQKELEEARKDNAVLREALIRLKDGDDVCMSSAAGVDDVSCSWLFGKDVVEICEKALSQTPTDMICFTREELMEPSIEAIGAFYRAYEKPLSPDTWESYFGNAWKALIAQLLKEREDK